MTKTGQAETQAQFYADRYNATSLREIADHARKVASGQYPNDAMSEQERDAFERLYGALVSVMALQKR